MALCRSAPLGWLTATLVIVGCLAACGNGGDDAPADVATSKTPSTTAGTAASPSASDPGSTSQAPPPSSGQPTSPQGAVAMSDWLTVGSLKVRAVAYQKAGVEDADNDTRIDVVTVEECAESETTVQHTTWHLVDAAGRTLGVAGGKLVNGHPTEDIPGTISGGECTTTKLVIGVSHEAEAVAVKDGPAATWLLAD